MRVRWLVMVVAAATASGCFLSRGTPLARRIEPGRPMADDGGDAYLVWADPGGWHLRARTDGVPHRFHGVVGTPEVTPIGVPSSALTSRGGEVAFSFESSEGEVGFDWPGRGCTELDLFVDGETRPLLVRIGAYGASPARIPFSLCR